MVMAIALMCTHWLGPTRPKITMAVAAVSGVAYATHGTSAYVLARAVVRSERDIGFVIGLVSAMTAAAQIVVAAVSGAVVQATGSATGLFVGAGALVALLDALVLTTDSLSRREPGA